ncbi:MAG TPA: hypothetical protein VHN39_12515 [Phenylobacterium sp.]|jgi:hypothetical protein|nr:hypothetical protein [Phenylobacterium sp.]
MDEAFQILDMIARGSQIDSAAEERWIPAFMTIRWVSRSSKGFVLTPEGRQGHGALVMDRPSLGPRRSRALQLAD